MANNNRKGASVDPTEELLFSLAEAMARQLPKKRRPRFVRDWLAITAELEGGATLIKGTSGEARKLAAQMVRDRTPALLSRLVE